jgi:RNA polymerase sigma-70 factor (family 1)
MRQKVINKKSMLSDRHLFERISEGEEQAFHLFFRRYHQRMVTFTGKVVKLPHVAEEIVQEVFIRIWENRGTLADIRNPEDYLFILIRNHALNHLCAAAIEERRREQLWEALEQQAADMTSALEIKEAEAFFAKILAKLTPQQQLIFRMNREEGLSHLQIAEKLNLSRHTVKKHVANSMKIFKANLKYFGQLFL